MILVIGYGNPLCGDDGIGTYAVERLDDDETLSHVDCLVVRQLTPELAETISRVHVVIFVDAAYGETPGQIACRELMPADEQPEAGPGAFTHHVNPTALLESALFLYGQRPTAFLYTVTGENFALGDAFSPAVEAAIPSLLEHLKARISQCMNLV
ncbi:MAG: hydrogenase maturation protease [Pleurocapsa minor GSE-CHR-MK-17-07R]|jgi:hydrogenase maturation protease|nr:hydrogenase maturation protease [Pleurocapsa minor GSE-CHR-MK 17-07R]